MCILYIQAHFNILNFFIYMDRQDLQDKEDKTPIKLFSLLSSSSSLIRLHKVFPSVSHKISVSSNWIKAKKHFLTEAQRHRGQQIKATLKLTNFKIKKFNHLCAFLTVVVRHFFFFLDPKADLNKKVNQKKNHRGHGESKTK